MQTCVSLKWRWLVAQLWIGVIVLHCGHQFSHMQFAADALAYGCVVKVVFNVAVKGFLDVAAVWAQAQAHSVTSCNFPDICVVVGC